MEEIVKLLESLGFEKVSNSDMMFTYNNEIYYSVVGKDFETVKREAEMIIKNSVAEEVMKGELEGDKEEDAETLPFNAEDDDPFISNSEEVEPFYLAPELKAVDTPVFRRLSLDGNRYYYRVMDDGNVRIYASATNLIADGYAEKKDSLNEWKQMMKMLGKNPEEVSQYEADKGTIMHFLYGLYLTGRDMYLRRSYIVKTVLESDLKISKQNMDRFSHSLDDIDDMINRLKKFAKFCSDYKVKVLAIEKILSCEEYEVASPIDAIVEMSQWETVEGYFGAVYQRATGEHKKGDPKKETKKVERRINAILDFKSGGIYPSYALQLHLYRLMVKEWYGEVLDIEKIYNFSPKSESSKGYTLRDQTDCSELRKADVVYKQGMINHQNKDKKFRTYKGVLNIGKEYNDDDYTIEYDIAEELSKRFKRED